MAVMETPRKSALVLKLDAGRTASGSVIMKSCSLGKVLNAADKTKVMAVVDLVTPLLVYPLLRVERTEVSIIENQ